MTQDITLPGPIFEARSLNMNKSVGPVQGVVGEDLVASFPKMRRLELESYSMRSNRALKSRSKGMCYLL